jgi:ABC-type transport system involved in multi-copper enzyme maturation permease subunit
MTRVFAYERVRARTIKSTYVFPLIGAAIAWAASVAFVAFGSDGAEVEASAFVGQAFTPVSAVFLTIPFAQAFGHEYRDGTMRLALSEFPRRPQLFFAKLAIPAVIAFLATIITITGIAVIVAAAPLFGFGDVTGIGGLAAISAREAIFVVLWGLLVAAITALTRNMAAGIAGVLVWALIGENVLGLFLIDRLPIIADLLPIGQGFGWVQSGNMSAIIPMLVVSLGLTALSYLKFVRTDA